MGLRLPVAIQGDGGKIEQVYLNSVSSGECGFDFNIFCITGPLCGEFTGHWWIPLTKASAWSFDVLFDRHLHKQLSKQLRRLWFETQSH